MNKKKIYPKEGESWTMVTGEELKKKGFKLTTTAHYVHPELPRVAICHLSNGKTISEDWTMVIQGYEEENVVILRNVKYMYQIDNMFHGFTDRWLGLI